MRGRRASTSSPSTPLARGKTPSSSPTRHTTRCGTERIGTIVQTVSVPVRKLARVGRPRRRCWSSARTSACRSRVSLSPAPAAIRASSRSNCATCQLSSSGVDVSRCTPSPRTRVQSTDRAGGLGRRSRKRVQAVDDLGEAAGQLEVAVADVVDGQRAGDLAVVGPDMAAPSSTRSRPAAQVLASRPAQPEVGAVVGVVAPPDAGLADPPGDALEVVVAEAEARAHRVGAGQVEHLGGGEPAARRARRAGRRRRAAGWWRRGSGRPAAPAAGGRGARGPRRRRRARSPAEISGA